MTIDAILFDIDGTLVDSNDFHVEAWDEALRAAGHAFGKRVIHDQIGKGSDTFLSSLLPDLQAKRQKEIAEAHGEIFKTKYLNRVRAFPKARKLLDKVHHLGQKVVLASSASQEELDHYIELLDVQSLIAATTSKDDVETSKPAPDIFGTALKKLRNPAPDTVLVIGDTPYDIEAAAKCRLGTVAVLSGGFPREILDRAGAIAIYDDVAALFSGYEASPIALKDRRKA